MRKNEAGIGEGVGSSSSRSSSASTHQSGALRMIAQERQKLAF